MKSERDNFGLLKRLWFLNVWYSFWEKVSYVDLGNMLQETSLVIYLTRRIIKCKHKSMINKINYLQVYVEWKKMLTALQHLPSFIQKSYYATRFLNIKKGNIMLEKQHIERTGDHIFPETCLSNQNTKLQRELPATNSVILRNLKMKVHIKWDSPSPFWSISSTWNKIL